MKNNLRFNLPHHELGIPVIEREIAKLRFREIICSYDEIAVCISYTTKPEGHSNTDYTINRQGVWEFVFSDRRSLDDYTEVVENIDSNEAIVFLANICNLIKGEATLKSEDKKYVGNYKDGVVKITDCDNNQKYVGVYRDGFWDFTCEKRKFIGFYRSGKHELLEITSN